MKIPLTQLRLVLVLFLALLVASCSTKTDVDDEFEDYLSRLENALDVKQTSVPPLLETASYPSTTIAIERVTITLLDFLRLFGCELQYTIGQRNNQIGKVAPASQQLINALMFQQQAKSCIDLQYQRGNDSLADELALVSEQKRFQLPSLIYNATLASTEFSAMWQYRPTADYPHSVSTEMVSAIERLNTFSKAWLAGEYDVGLSELEATLGLIRQGDVGTLWHVLALGDQQLTLANQLIIARTGEKKLCLMGKSNQKSRVFETVVLKFFIKRIQSRQALINKRYHQLLPAINALEDTLKPILTPEYRNWRQMRESSLTQLLAAPKEHVAHIKLLVKQCGSNFGGGSI